MFFRKKQKLATYNFFVVDDEPEILEMLTDQLEELYDCRVHTFSNLDDCLNSLDSLTIAPDVIISDVRMPGMSGFTLQSELDKRSLSIPVILITGIPGEEIDDGKTIVLSKPYRIHQIKKIIDRFL